MSEFIVLLEMGTDFKKQKKKKVLIKHHKVKAPFQSWIHTLAHNDQQIYKADKV